MAELQFSRFIENPACETLTIIGSKMHPFNSSAGTKSRQEKHTDTNEHRTTNIFNIFENKCFAIEILNRTDTTAPNQKLPNGIYPPGTESCKRIECSDIENNNQVL